MLPDIAGLLNGGGEGSRTPVQKTYKTRRYECSSFSYLTLWSK